MQVICGLNVVLTGHVFRGETKKSCLYLLLTENQQALWFDGMIWRQILSTPPLDTILKSFPNTITSGPGHTDMMPLPIIDQERQLCNL